MAWCDDPKSKFYNKQIKLPSRYSYEKLYRKDRIYDIIISLDYNTNPIIKNKGSAIFLHVAKKNYKPTAGCIALKKEDLIHLLSVIKKGNKIKII
jgi:L,D-peptidoglycan transpeptidase YkuD (ErfK/YbiS/YcfS/YnhG family)